MLFFYILGKFKMDVLFLISVLLPKYFHFYMGGTLKKYKIMLTFYCLCCILNVCQSLFDLLTLVVRLKFRTFVSFMCTMFTQRKGCFFMLKKENYLLETAGFSEIEPTAFNKNEKKLIRRGNRRANDFLYSIDAHYLTRLERISTSVEYNLKRIFKKTLRILRTPFKKLYYSLKLKNQRRIVKRNLKLLDQAGLTAIEPVNHTAKNNRNNIRLLNRVGLTAVEPVISNKQRTI